MFHNHTNSPVVKNFRQGGLLLSSASRTAGSIFETAKTLCKGGVETLLRKGNNDSYNNTINL